MAALTPAETLIVPLPVERNDRTLNPRFKQKRSEPSSRQVGGDGQSGARVALVGVPCESRATG